MAKHKRPRKHFWKMGLIAAASLVWLIVRSGRKPSRIVYPCQRAAVANIHVFLLALLAPLLSIKKPSEVFPRVTHRAVGTVLLVGLLLVAFESVPLALDYQQLANYDLYVPLDLRSQIALPSGGSDLFLVENASGTDGNMDLAVSTLFRLMANHGLFFFKTLTKPSGLIGKDDFVLIKVNCQWEQRGGTNTDLVKSIIKKIVNHPEGFNGEIVVADNGQGRGSLDWAESNAFNHSQSMKDIVDMFPSHKVSIWLWDAIRSNNVKEYSQGDFRDGYVVNSTQNVLTHVRVSYPKFKTKHGTYVSFKHGIWDNATSAYDSEKLKVINVPVLKSHSIYGVTASVKHYMGVVSNQLTDTHSVIGDGALGAVMVEARAPALNILDAIWVNANPMESGDACGPYTSYPSASFTDVVGASIDPVALDYWTSKHILLQAAIHKNYTSYSSLDPDYTSGPYHRYLENSMNELEKKGLQSTMNETEMNVYISTSPSAVIPGDINGDYTVDADDANLLATAFGSIPGNPDWNVNADINGDDVVNILDAILLANHFLEHYP